MSWMEFMMKRLIVAIVVVLAGLVLASPAQAYPVMPQGVQGPYTVLKVVDGDTIHVSANGQKLKIRMIGLDTPETVDPRKPVQCFGLEASAQAKTRGRGLLAVETVEDGVVDASVTTIAGAKRGHDGHRKPDLLT